ncbi:MAG: hypothetical protein ABI618_03140 [Nitrospirota bacterium]
MSMTIDGILGRVRTASSDQAALKSLALANQSGDDAVSFIKATME